MRIPVILTHLTFLSASLVTQGAEANELFRIRIIETESGWPVPLVELSTTHHVRFVSDNTGTIAFDLPELMGVETWFTVEGHGYEVPKDGLGYRGVRLTPEPGQEAVVKVQRRLPGKRLGRITGGGLFGESQRFGDNLDWTDQGLLGCDSTQNALYQGKLFWAWGDTVLPGYPLGLFHMIGATTSLQPLKTFEPPIQLRYDYFCNEEGNPRVIAEIAGRGPTWISGCVSLPTKDGKEKLVATYNKIKPPLTVYEAGLCVWNDEKKVFNHFRTLWTKSDDGTKPPPMPDGHAVFQTDENGRQWVLFGYNFPQLKCPKTFEAWSDSDSWIELEIPAAVRAANDQDDIIPHRASTGWSQYRRKWVAIFTQKNGESSELGEIWYTEADEPTGPWRPAVKVVTHNKYTFYNPLLHTPWTPVDSGILMFEATYTQMFSGSTNPTPRHEYNQVLYRLDLDQLAEEMQ